MYLVESGADFVKVELAGFNMYYQEQKGIGRGQASAVIEVAKARMSILKNRYLHSNLL